MTVSHHALKYLDLNEDLVVKSDLNMDASISGSDSSEKCFEFYLRMKAILNEGNLNLRKWISNCAKIISSRSKSLARKLFTLISFIKFWVFCGTLKLINCSLI